MSICEVDGFFVIAITSYGGFFGSDARNEVLNSSEIKSKGKIYVIHYLLWLQ